MNFKLDEIRLYINLDKRNWLNGQTLTRSIHEGTISPDGEFKLNDSFSHDRCRLSTNYEADQPVFIQTNKFPRSLSHYISTLYLYFTNINEIKISLKTFK